MSDTPLILMKAIAETNNIIKSEPAMATNKGRVKMSKKQVAPPPTNKKNCR